MYFAIVTYGITALVLLLPLYLLYRLWTRDFGSLGRWLVSAVHLAGALAFFFVIGRWDIVGRGLRGWLYGAYLVVGIASWVRVRGLGLRPRDPKGWGRGTAAEAVFLLGASVWALVGGPPARAALELEPPLRDGSYYVVQGGGTPLTNYHGLFAHSQTYALDISALEGAPGVRASGVYPDEPERYAVFGDPVYAPLGGTVVRAVDTLPDQDPPETLGDRPAGNQLWIRRDSLYLLLAHLREGSVRVAAGERVRAGELVARVGNTGNTAEPHLHVHAVALPEGAAPSPDSLLGAGTPVPIRFGEELPMRNDLLGGA